MCVYSEEKIVMMMGSKQIVGSVGAMEKSQSKEG